MDRFSADDGRKRAVTYQGSPCYFNPLVVIGGLRCRPENPCPRGLSDHPFVKACRAFLALKYAFPPVVGQ